MANTVCRLIVALASALPFGVRAADTSPHCQASLLSELNTVSPGSSFLVGFRIKMDKGWHVYWKNPGDSGLPISIDWKLPKGFTVGELQWPYPHQLGSADVRSYGYEDEVVLLARVVAPKNLKPGAQTAIKADAKWLICAEGCLNASDAPSLNLTVSSRAKQNNVAEATLAKWKKRLPTKNGGWTFSAKRTGQEYLLDARLPQSTQVSTKGAWFYPDQAQVIDQSAEQKFSIRNGALAVALPRSPYSNKPPSRLKGVLVVPSGSGVQALVVDAPISS